MKMTVRYTPEEIFKLIELDLYQKRSLVVSAKPKALVTTRTEGMYHDTWQVSVFDGVEVEVQDKGYL